MSLPQTASPCDLWLEDLAARHDTETGDPAAWLPWVDEYRWEPTIAPNSLEGTIYGFEFPGIVSPQLARQLAYGNCH